MVAEEPRGAHVRLRVTTAIVRAVSEPQPDPGPSERKLRERARQARDQAVEARRHAEEVIRLEGSRRGWLGILVAAYDRDRRRAGGLLSGGLAFRLFLWLLPFTLVLVTFLGFLADWLDQTPAQLIHDTGLSSVVAGTVEEGISHSSRGGVVLFGIGLVLLLWAARSIVRALWVIHIVAWELRPRPLHQQFTASVVFTVGCIGLIALHVAASPLYAGGFVPDLFVTLGLTVAVSVCAYAAFRRLPHRSSGWRIFAPGALLFGVGLECLRLLTAVYFTGKIDRVNDLYGSLGLATVILAWLFLLGRLAVGGTMLNASMVPENAPEDLTSSDLSPQDPSPDPPAL